MAVERIHILHTNDLHSHFSNMLKIASFIKKFRAEKEEKGEKVLVIDIGDHMDRMRVETEGTNGEVNRALLEHSGVDFAVIGNNEGLTFTKEQLYHLYDRTTFTVLVCNLIDKITEEYPNWVKPYHIYKQNNLQIAFIGATAPMRTFYNLMGWQTIDPISKIKEIVDELKDKVDLIILLSHLGLKKDEIIAEEIKGIDVILGGHTHHLLGNKVKEKESTLIAQAGIFGEHIGHLTIEMGNTKQQMLLKSELISIVDFPEDIEGKKLLNYYHQLAIKRLQQKVAVVSEPIPIAWDQESQLANILVDGIAKWVGTSIAFVNSGQILANLPSGHITKLQLHEICPSPINPCKVKISGKEIISILEKALEKDRFFKQIRGFGFRGKVFGLMAIAGLEVYYREVEEKNKIISVINLETGKEIVLEEEYTVGAIDMFTFGGEFTEFQEAKKIKYYVPEFLRDILEKQLQIETAINNGKIRRYIKVK